MLRVVAFDCSVACHTQSWAECWEVKQLFVWLNFFFIFLQINTTVCATLQALAVTGKTLFNHCRMEKRKR